MSNKIEELMKLRKAELDSMCRERNITLYVGKNHINKEEMVKRIIAHDEQNAVQETKVEEVKTKVEEKPARNSGTTIGDMVDMKTIKEQISDVKPTPEIQKPWILGNKKEAIEKAEVGTLVAFLDEKGKPRTGKLENRSSSRQVVKLVTEFDWTFIVPYDKVLWVRFDSRWPKAIYKMLKEYKNGQMPNIVTKESD